MLAAVRGGSAPQAVDEARQRGYGRVLRHPPIVKLSLREHIRQALHLQAHDRESRPRLAWAAPFRMKTIVARGVQRARNVRFS
jgi:hypothetical protein